jgi:hypothetical protein
LLPNASPTLAADEGDPALAVDGAGWLAWVEATSFEVPTDFSVAPGDVCGAAPVFFTNDMRGSVWLVGSRPYVKIRLFSFDIDGKTGLP